MERITLKSYAKFNPVLEVLGRDPATGMHYISTVLCNLDHFDAVTVEKLPAGFAHSSPASAIQGRGALEIILDGDAQGHMLNGEDAAATSFSFKTAIPSDKSNIVAKAWEAVTEWADEPLSASVRLLKRIPPASGLGGGSGNAAAAMVGLIRLFNLPILPEELCDLAARVGADVPFFLAGGLMLGENYGEKTTDLGEPPDFCALVLKPVEGSSTPDAYEKLDELLGIKDGVSRSARSTRGFVNSIRSGGNFIPHMRNDFDVSALKTLPATGALFAWLQAHGAERAIVAGSGSAVVGIYAEQPQAGIEQAAVAELGELLECAFLVNPVNTGIEVVDWE